MNHTIKNNANKLITHLLAIYFTIAVMPDAHAHEFASMVTVNSIHTKDAGNGRSVGFYYGGFGLMAGIEMKKYREKSTGALILNMMLGTGSVGVELSSLGTTLRAEALIPLDRYINLADDSRLNINIGFEKNLKNDEFSGVFLGLSMMFFD